MKVTWSPAKEAQNLADGRPSFEEVNRFNFATAFFWQDTRKDYGEVRWSGLGFVGQRLHALVFVETAEGIHAISFRKANKREVKRYEKAIRG